MGATGCQTGLGKDSREGTTNGMAGLQPGYPVPVRPNDTALQVMTRAVQALSYVISYRDSAPILGQVRLTIVAFRFPLIRRYSVG
jgi:hypothetical protein